MIIISTAAFAVQQYSNTAAAQAHTWLSMSSLHVMVATMIALSLLMYCCTSCLTSSTLLPSSPCSVWMMPVWCSQCRSAAVCSRP